MKSDQGILNGRAIFRCLLQEVGIKEYEAFGQYLCQVRKYLNCFLFQLTFEDYCILLTSEVTKIL
jgi:hypothetical protein